MGQDSAARVIPATPLSHATGPALSGESEPRALFPSGAKCAPRYGKEVNNLYSQFARSAAMYGSNKCLGNRTSGGKGSFVFETYDAIHAKVLEVGSGVAGLGYGPKDHVGLYSANCPNFQVCVLGSFSQGMACVPIYDTLGENIVEYEVNHAELKMVFVEATKLMAVANVLSRCPMLKHVVSFSPLAEVSEEVKAVFCNSASCELLDIVTLRAKGCDQPVSPRPPAPDDLAFIMYTSGTTGNPKGVMLTQLGITIATSWGAGIELFPSDRFLSFLPLAHIFSTTVEHGLLSVGASIGFFSGNLKLLSDDILALKPTLFCGVPRVYARFYEKAHQAIDAKKGMIKKLLLHALNTEISAVNRGKHTCWGRVLSRLLGAKVHGGCVRIMISGAAPLPGHVHEFLTAACGCHVLEGYGMTENCAQATIALMGDLRKGHVGPPMPTVEVKLVDVPEMNYTFAGNKSGEVCTKGVVNTIGYYKDAEETSKILEGEWLHTGDIGQWNANGTLTIIDRKKNIFKLSQGEYIAAEKIENVLTKSKFISQLWCYGNSFLPMLVCVVTPDFTELEPYAKAKGWHVADKVSLAALAESRALIMQEIASEAKACKLKSFEIPKAIHLEGNINELLQGFSIENDCLTPTFKLKRPQLLKRYKAEVDAMYMSLGEDPSKTNG
eukprot:CAMPEP_0119321898 /NCGR_PEP_ID=MMETSP1333-20130426/56729_1 /TAXON_ID=418940 /ORGANISM="Scyphosphaera apsteinii, Strain RCC1455" /LENGTH=666 /DNA_ID=CAMNT_0007328987 /DNA_START=19 /DNA_END=2019 /DNA_ORIENTATION=+